MSQVHELVKIALLDRILVTIQHPWSLGACKSHFIVTPLRALSDVAADYMEVSLRVFVADHLIEEIVGNDPLLEIREYREVARADQLKSFICGVGWISAYGMPREGMVTR
jgi:hypothetical protein